MEIIRVHYDFKNDYEKISEFSNWDKENIYKLNLDIAFYWYASGSSEGSGYLLMKKGDEWYLHNCGHCSCHGPTDIIELKNGKTLDEIENSLSDGLRKEVMPLIIRAKQ